MTFGRLLVDLITLPLTGMPLGSFCSDDPNDNILEDVNKVVEKMTGQ